MEILSLPENEPFITGIEESIYRYMLQSDHEVSRRIYFSLP